MTFYLCIQSIQISFLLLFALFYLLLLVFLDFVYIRLVLLEVGKLYIDFVCSVVANENYEIHF